MPTLRATLTKLTATAAAVVLVATACSDEGDTSSEHNGHDSPSPTASASTGTHNANDVRFAQQMIPHHRQAVEMADLAKTRADSAEVRRLAEKIEKAQQPEIDKMSTWLKTWGEPVPAETPAADHAGHGTSGMMTAEDMKKLEQSSGKAFDTMFLEMMVEHHEGAVTMSKTERDKGRYQPARDMARDIIRSQTTEIKQMNELLDKD